MSKVVDTLALVVGWRIAEVPDGAAGGGAGTIGMRHRGHRRGGRSGDGQRNRCGQDERPQVERELGRVGRSAGRRLMHRRQMLATVRGTPAHRAPAAAAHGGPWALGGASIACGERPLTIW